MKNNWFLSAVVIILAIVGFSVERASTPNQEIILQFARTDAELEQTQDAIALIKEQLTNLNVEQIHIVRLDNGNLKIKYFSNIEIATIKQIFSKVEGLKHSTSTNNEEENVPTKNETQQYLFEVFKIQQGKDLLGASHGLLVEYPSDTTRLLPINMYGSLSKRPLAESASKQILQYNAHHDPAIALENTSYKIPLVRAGPIS